MLCNPVTAEGLSGDTDDYSAVEVAYEENENFMEGIQIELFNLEKEREEGYFDAEGNFVEYINENEIKDAWLDSVQVDERYAGKTSVASINEDDDKDDGRDLSSEEIGMMKSQLHHYPFLFIWWCRVLEAELERLDKHEPNSVDTSAAFYGGATTSVLW